MFRINLIKIVFSFSLSLLASLSFAEGEVKVIDQNGQPIVHALVQVGKQKPIPVDAKGAISLADLVGQESILIFAHGYETRTLSPEDCEGLDQIVLRTKESALEEVVVSATRTDRSVEDLPMPVTVLGKEKIQQTGGIRLSEVLREQTGLQISSDHGAGLQMQGLDSDYILILLDGEPLIGRTAGTFDLDRMSVSNIERIEILRGPSSAIYGSEAMAGVINIITKTGVQPKTVNLGLRHRSFNSWNPFVELGVRNDSWQVDGLIRLFPNGRL